MLPSHSRLAYPDFRPSYATAPNQRDKTPGVFLSHGVSPFASSSYLPAGPSDWDGTDAGSCLRSAEQTDTIIINRK